MTYENDLERDHRLVAEGRRRLLVSGVEEVARFDEESIVLTTVLGELEISGEELHIEKLSLEGGELQVDGKISGLNYSDRMEREEPGLLRRLFGG